MRIEQQLQVGILALLLSLVAIAGPANSQGPTDCLVFPPDPTCAGDPPTVPPEGVPPEGCDPADVGFPDSCTGPLPDLNALCALGDPEGTFPSCIQAPGLEALDALCALGDPESTFPDCLLGVPSILPEGCDPQGEGFPQVECGVPAPGLEALDALCALGDDTGTFPTCLAGVPEIGLDALCALPVAEDPEGAFPDCMGDAPGLEALDALCALGDDTGTFPTCLAGVPGILPEGCDPAGEGFPQEECGIPAPGLGALDTLCALGEDTEGTFPDCIGAPGLDALNGLCALGDPEGTFPDCLGTPDASALDALCALPIAADPEGTFPACLGTPGLDSLCDLPVADPDADPVFPDCLGSAPDASVLDALCALPVADPDADPVFPGCLGGAPGGLPEGCDPSGDDFPQEACGVPDVPDPTATNTAPVAAAGADQDVDEGDLVTLDGSGSSDADDDALTYVWDCPGQTLTDATSAVATFTAPAVSSLTTIVCTLTVNDGTDNSSPDSTDINVADTNVAPVVNAGDDQTVDEGDLVSLDGTATDAEALTIDWSCLPVQTLGSATSVDTTFTAPLVDEAGADVVCTLSADDGDLSSSDETTIHIVDVPDPVDVVLSFSIDSLASQGIDNTVLVTGTVTSNVDLAGAEIGIALTDPQPALTGSGAQNIVYADGDVDTIDLAAGEAESFEAQVTWNAYETVSWTITVADGSTSFPVTFAADATYIDFGAGNAPASLALAGLSTSSYSPDNLAPSDLTSVLTVTDNNGAGDGTEADYGRIVDANIVVGIASDSDATSAVLGAGLNEVADPALSRDFGVTVSLPARLKDDTYTLTASYTNPIAGSETVADLTDSVTRTLSVENVAPVIDVAAPGAFVGTARIASFGLVSFSVDDFNAGTLNGAAVTELESLSLAVHEAAGGACTGALAVQGLSLGFPDEDVEDATLDLSDVAFNAAIPVVASLSWATTAVAGDYELCATLSDGALSDADVLLATFELDALNEGFFLTVDDGGDGLSAPGADPGHSTTTEALSVLLSGTIGADELMVTVGNFQRSPGPLTFTASNLNGKLCLAATCLGDDVIAEEAGVGGVVTFTDLSAVALPGVELFVVFEFDVPLGTAAGNYAAPITVGGLEA